MLLRASYRLFRTTERIHEHVTALRRCTLLDGTE